MVEDCELGHGGHDTLDTTVNRRPQLRIVAPDASPEEAAAVVAALERFMRDTAPPRQRRLAPRSPWFEAALREVRPSTGPWFSSARGVAMFANEGGAYDELVAYFREHPNE